MHWKLGQKLKGGRAKEMERIRRDEKMKRKEIALAMTKELDTDHPTSRISLFVGSILCHLATHPMCSIFKRP